jgi:DNA polymerase V
VWCARCRGDRRVWALADGNNFYCSVEAVFDPRVRGKPLVVLSSNDGNAVARNPEAKALGIKMGQPAFELKHLVKSHGLVMRSSNFTLYGDMSARVLAVTREMCPRTFVYSVDDTRDLRSMDAYSTVAHMDALRDT